MKIALVHLVRYGDVLYATLVARQIKRDYPGCQLTFFVSRDNASVLTGNPDVDVVERVDLSSLGNPYSDGWRRVRASVEARVRAGEFARAFFTQVGPDNFALYDGLIRSTTYRAYGGEVGGPHRPVLVNTSEEKQRALNFASDHGFSRFRQVFLFECNPGSGQSPLNPTRALSIARSLLSKRDGDVLFVLSSHSALPTPIPGLADASQLNFRENAALTHYCTGLIGCSSGLTWLATSEAARPLPMLQILGRTDTPFCFASVACDYRRFGLDESSVIELADPDDGKVVECLLRWMDEGHQAARRAFHETLRPTPALARNAVRLSFRCRGYGAAWLTAWRFIASWGLGCLAGGELLRCTGSVFVRKLRQIARVALRHAACGWLNRLSRRLAVSRGMEWLKHNE